MSHAELRRTVLIAATAAAAMYVFLTVFDEPMSAPYVPALRIARVTPPVLARRVGRPHGFRLGNIRPGASLRYLDTVRLMADLPDEIYRAAGPEPVPVEFAIDNAAGSVEFAQMETGRDNTPGVALTGLVRPEEYDFGRYKSLALPPLPGEIREDVRGFMHIPTVWGTTLEPALPAMGIAERVGEAVRRFTGIEVFEDPLVYLDSPRLLDYPVLFLTAEYLFDLSPQEKENLHRYLDAGGFIIMDNPAPKLPFNGMEASFRKMMRDISGARGRIGPIPENHLLYHIVYDFDLPPIGREIGTFLLFSKGGGLSGLRIGRNSISPYVYYLEGLWFDGRLAGVFTDKGYSLDLAEETGLINDDYEHNYPLDIVFYSELSRGLSIKYHPATFKFVTNMVVYALLDPNGMTRRRMQAYLEQ